MQLTGPLWWDRTQNGRAATSRGEVIVGGRRNEVRSKSRIDLRFDFPDDLAMRISHKRRSISRCTSRGVARWNGSWSRAVAPVGRRVNLVAERGNSAPGSSPRR